MPPKAEKKEEEEKGVEDGSNPDVVTKYRLAGDLANKALSFVISQCKAGAKMVDICEAGDKYILDECAKIFKGKKVEKGVGFPTCVSVNNIVGHFSPLGGDDRELKAGDITKIDLGVHVDGYIAVGAHTIVVGADGESKEEVTGRVADVMLAAHTAAELAIRMIKPGAKNTTLTDMFAKVAEEFGVTPLGGVLSHQMTRFLIDGEKVIISKAEVDQKVDEFEFEPNTVFAIDIVMSTGEGKPREIDERTCVYKRAVDETYQLKMKASRSVLSDINARFPTFPFTIRAMDEKTVRLGIVECAKHQLVHGYPVLFEKEGETLAHLKFTCLIMPTGTIKLSGLPINVDQFKTENKLKDEELVKVMATSAGKKKKKNKNKKKKGDAKEGGDEE